jgi:sugar phosphate isomerase/epimerase
MSTPVKDQQTAKLWFTKKFVNETLAEVINEIHALGFNTSPINPEVKPSNSIRQYGYCRHTKDNEGVRYCTISISRNHTSPEDVRETIAHEVCHTVLDTKGHGDYWKRIAAKMNETYGYHIRRCSS